MLIEGIEKLTVTRAASTGSWSERRFGRLARLVANVTSAWWVIAGRCSWL